MIVRLVVRWPLGKRDTTNFSDTTQAPPGRSAVGKNPRERWHVTTEKHGCVVLLLQRQDK
jgi:hypothetical protein